MTTDTSSTKVTRSTRELRVANTDRPRRLIDRGFPKRILLLGRIYSRRSVVSMAFLVHILYSHKEWVIPSFLAKNKMFRWDYLFRNLISHTVKANKQQQTKPIVLEDLSCRSVTAMPFFKCPQQSANLITLTVKEMFSLPVRISNTVKK